MFTIFYLVLQITAMNAYSNLQSKKIHQHTLISWHLQEIIPKIKKGISTKSKFIDPCIIRINTQIHPAIFCNLYHTINDFRYEKFPDLVECNVIRNKKSKVISYKICFKRLGIFKYHMKKLLGTEIDEFLTKTFPDKSVGSITASDPNPIVITYKLRTSKCSFQLGYQIKSIYGVVISQKDETITETEE